MSVFVVECTIEGSTASEGVFSSHGKAMDHLRKDPGFAKCRAERGDRCFRSSGALRYYIYEFEIDESYEA